MDWISGIDTGNAFDRGPIVDNPETAYFTFNYTNTIENLLHVSKDRVFHIHGSVENRIHFLVAQTSEVDE